MSVQSAATTPPQTFSTPSGKSERCRTKGFALAFLIAALATVVIAGLGVFLLTAPPSAIPYSLAAISPFGAIAMIAVGTTFSIPLIALGTALACKKN